ncbi:hypothetical protein KFE25_005708 [Diacronema lutheri]|uniref:Rab-GAP TBC domain-containing protein n=2 Tax=Diacronema lutheri TaxID=2081491 RepID=A0A8J5XEC5_DIALT|nr:hypothetical protein KFE25_005708 [Diacronema lutheri]
MAEVVGCGCAPTVRRRRGWRRPGSVFPLEAIIVSTATAPAALPPLSLAELDATPGLVEPDGALGDVPALLARVHESGIEPTLRPRLWLHLLGVVPWRASAVRLATLRAKRAHAYAAALALWAADDEAGALGACAHGSVAKYHRIIAVDVPRTDRALDRWRAPESLAPLRRVLLSACALSSAPGYFQGMNDLAAVLLDALGGDEADAFASFVALLHGKLALSFEDEQRGIWRQAAAVVGALRAIDPPLHAALGAAGAIGDNGECLVLFQPIFLALKREIGTGPKGDYEGVCRAWETWWAAADPLAPSGRATSGRTNCGCAHYELVLILAFLELHRAAIRSNRQGVAGLTKLLNGGGAGAIDPRELLRYARAIHTALWEFADRRGARGGGGGGGSGGGDSAGGSVHAILTSQRLVVASSPYSTPPAVRSSTDAPTLLDAALSA